jgi:tRNA-specific 2-thiouridylase
MKKKVLVAMSGGVDSSVTAFLLKEQGYQVVGLTMCLGIKAGDDEKPRCCGIQAIEDAKRVCRKLKIPHYVMDFFKELQEKVVNNFISEYNKGRTPNPCIDCNRYIKFGTLLKKAISMEFDFLSTGHYARIEKREFSRSGIKLGGGIPLEAGRVESLELREKAKTQYILKKGIDAKKDQSYVLYTMTQEQLGHTLMPLGNLTKNRVRQIAREKDLPVADKPESQEICFIPNNNYGEFLNEYISLGAKPGPIVNNQGKVIGEHQGIIFYTIGQRKGIGIASREPLYVIAIKKEINTIVVGKKEEAYSYELVANNTNFIVERLTQPLRAGAGLRTPIRVEAKIRYLHQSSPATVIPLSEEEIKVKFDRPQWAITPGQAVVFYLPAGRQGNGDIVIGGGTIVSGGKTKGNE